ncbi:leucine-rich repeat receptor-like protein kinase TDR [Telopea speciosissima]|uniref:leucine-rich repeat receptor-like protein kinase TDR n=1 Tax=Telopea speciosissima TaxID=54955 RepID=UPI001CC4B37C|nr:leucine-rich repeat receptor-like protein kinase TDR [Telopea speciosissima]
MKPSSPFSVSFFFFFIFLLKATLVLSATLPLQLVSLLSLKASLKDPLSSLHDWNPNTLSTNTGLSNPVWCSWSGVVCDQKTSQVTSLDLSHRNLSGLIPPEIRFLSELNNLNLSWNAFDGAFPTTIFELYKLRTLDISRNNFSSIFPPGISKLRFLTVFNAFSNSFTGSLPQEIIGLRFLEELNLGGSFFQGSIPAVYGGLPSLKFLHLAGNLLQGPIPTELSFLSRLEHLEIGYNEFSAGIPVELSLLSNLKYVDIANASLSGYLPSELGNLTLLESLFLFKNRFIGEIPVSFSSLVALKALDLSDNRLSGPIPEGFSSLKELTILSLMDNKLTGEIPDGIGEFINLEELNLWNNSLSGNLPDKLGSNAKLKKLDVSSNSLSGPIPPSLCLGNRLAKLILFSNRFDSEIPPILANCTSLWRLRIQDNRLTGAIPPGFGLLPNLTFMDFSMNNLSGDIPRDLGDSVRLELVNISRNPLGTALPSNIWSAPNLQIFSASSCKLKGKIPDFIGCRSLYKLQMEGNSLNGSIPWDIGHCEKLIYLSLQHNSLTGIIPWELSTLPSITDVDISHNFLTGTIPSNFGNCTTLESFNVSNNQLTGPIPSSGTLFHPSSFSGNEGLCGGIIEKPCASEINTDDSNSRRQPKKTAGAIVWIVATAFGVGLFILIAGSRCFRMNYNRRSVDEQRTGPWKLTAFQRLDFTADDVMECLSMSDKIIGMGSAGTVYMAEMPGGEIIAVKKLWSKNKETVRKRRGVLAEVDVLGNVRHRNIVRLLGYCSNNESTLLLYEYMPNGSLDDLLHGKNKAQNLVADWLTRYKIAMGIAQGICYLHHDCDPVIVHRDLKPSNILLDAEMEARVADFGVAKLFQIDESMSVIAGSYGYIAPEYAYTLQVDEKSDIYSFGVVLMEILSGKRSVEAEFGDGNSIVDWVRSKIKNKDGVTDILDKNAGASCVSVREEMMLLLRVALLCTSRNPADRPSMRDVVSMLHEAKPKRKLPSGADNATHGGGAGGGCGGGAPLVEKPDC